LRKLVDVLDLPRYIPGVVCSEPVFGTLVIQTPEPLVEGSPQHQTALSLASRAGFTTKPQFKDGQGGPTVVNAGSVGGGQVNRPSRKDYYDLLKVSRTAKRDEIKTAYREAARTIHPDVHPDKEFANDPDPKNPRKMKYEADMERFKEITQAYEVLSDTDDKRRRYDLGEDI
jgi:hypothetical protein